MSFFDDMLDDNVRKGERWNKAFPRFAVVLRLYHNIMAYHVIRPMNRGDDGRLYGLQVGGGHNSVRSAMDWIKADGVERRAIQESGSNDG